MALSSSYYSFFFFLFLFISLKAQAREVRESHFFNKETRNTNANEPETVVDKQLPNPKQEEPTTYTTQQSQNGYGLYGNRYSQDTPSTVTNYNEEYNARGLPSKYPTTEEVSLSTDTVYSNNRYADKPQGMSDTRFLENGRYFYDLNAENERKGYGYRSTRGNNMEYRSTRGDNNMGYYGSSKRVDSVNKYNYGGGNYGNNENAYEYDNSMDRFRNRQENEENYEP